MISGMKQQTLAVALERLADSMPAWLMHLSSTEMAEKVSATKILISEKQGDSDE